MKYHCEQCGYEGNCYGSPSSEGVSAPWCFQCGKNDKLVPLHVWKWRVADDFCYQRKERMKQLFVASVIIAVLCAATLYIGIGVWGYHKTIGDPANDPRPEFGTLSPHCWHITNHWQWAECMGVAYNGSIQK